MGAGLTTVALVTANQERDLYGDGSLLAAALTRLGIDSGVVAWGDAIDWAEFDAVLVRNTWDYIHDRRGFLAWALHVESVTRLANSFEVLTWNTDKRYLRSLEDAGIPTVPTLWVEPHQLTPPIPWDQFVVKPAVSAGARLTARYEMGDDPDLHVRRIHRSGSVAMVQPYLSEVDVHGETGTYVFGGEVSHAITKAAILTAAAAPSDELAAASHERVGPAKVDPSLAAFAVRVLEAVPPVLYARVDTVPGADGHPVLLELEVTEPYLFLEHDPPAADRFAAAVQRWLEGG